MLLNQVPTIDAYGKSENSPLDSIDISRSTYDQINFSQFDSKNIPTIADSYNEGSNIH